ncbi:MAG TPA: NarK family nitrate/nitrite MFS transporter [Candidatus Azoamicus sp. OHIO1]
MSYNLSDWHPEDNEYWSKKAKFIANRNLFSSIPCLLLAFSVWFIWSAVVVKLNSIGFNFTTEQLFRLTAMPGITGATLRIFYSFCVPIFGGRNWTVFSTATLLIPAIGIGIAVQDTNTSYNTMIVLAILCGFGGGNFSSSMSNISFFFPKRFQGTALGLNAGLGNLGVSTLQFVVPVVIYFGFFEFITGCPQEFIVNGKIERIWLQNAAYFWVIPVVLATISAFIFMDNLPTAKASLKEQMVIFKRKHMYIVTWLYVMSFGSFIGYSAAFPLLIKTQFPDVNPLRYAFLGPMVGALIRPVGGWISDKVKSGALITFVDLFVMIFAVLGVIYFISPGSKSFYGFFLMFILLFTTTGVANGSVFQMIPMIFPPKESAVVLGFSAAIAAYGAFLIPQSFGTSIKLTGGPEFALYCFEIYYVTCLIITWWYYLRANAEVKC